MEAKLKVGQKVRIIGKPHEYHVIDVAWSASRHMPFYTLQRIDGGAAGLPEIYLESLVEEIKKEQEMKSKFKVGQNVMDTRNGNVSKIVNSFTMHALSDGESLIVSHVREEFLVSAEEPKKEQEMKSNFKVGDKITVSPDAVRTANIYHGDHFGRDDVFTLISGGERCCSSFRWRCSSQDGKLTDFHEEDMTLVDDEKDKSEGKTRAEFTGDLMLDLMKALVRKLNGMEDKIDSLIEDFDCCDEDDDDGDSEDIEKRVFHDDLHDIVLHILKAMQEKEKK